jgi:hypothetical protein
MTTTIRNVEITIEDENHICVEFDGQRHSVAVTWDSVGAHVSLDSLRAVNASWDDTQLADLAYHGEAQLDDYYTREYRIVVPEGEYTEGYAILETIRAANDDAANDYAEQHHADADWYVLDADGNNINSVNENWDREND